MATTFNPKGEYEMGRGAEKPPYAPNVVNQTVDYGGATWKGNPGSDWTLQSGGNSSIGSSVDQLGQANNFTQGFNEKVASQPSYQDLWKTISSGFNYPQLSTTATDLQNQLAYLPQLYTQVQPGAMMSGPQREKQMNLQAWKLAPLAQRATAQAQTAGQLTSDQLAAAQAQQMKELLPYQTQAGLLQSILGNLTNILGAQIGQQYKMTPQGQLISTGAVPDTTGGSLGPYASQYFNQWTPFQ